jgi:hypothetical protein
LISSLPDDRQKIITNRVRTLKCDVSDKYYINLIAQVRALESESVEVEVQTTHALTRNIAEHFYVPQSNAKAFEDAMQQLAKDTNQRYSALLKRFNATPR